MQDPEDTWLPKQYRKIITGRLDTGELDTVGKGGGDPKTLTKELRGKSGPLSFWSFWVSFDILILPNHQHVC